MKYFLYIALLFPTFIYAQTTPTRQPGDTTPTTQPGTSGVVIPNPLGDMTLIGLFQTILNVVMIFAVPIIVLFIIYAGFMYVTAQGNAEKISTAHKALLYAVIGGVLILGANVLIDVIKGTVDSIGN